VAERFVSEAHRANVVSDTDPEALLDRMASFVPAVTEKWLDRDET
jgi:hypothetical protein